MAGKLTVDTATGRVTGPASISYNRPWPTANGEWGSGAMMGVVEHTMDGDLPGTISWFNSPESEASAFFGIDQAGNIHQFGPVGQGWIAWAEAGGNPEWYSIEHADDGDPATPLTGAQITASAQLVECLSAFAGFPLQVSDSVDVKGYGWHGMGGVAWGDHLDCPGDVRKAQRPQIIALAEAIRAGQPAPVPAPPAKPATTGQPREWTTAGESSLATLAAQQHAAVSTILRMTAERSPSSVFPSEVAAYLDAVFAGTADPAKPMPAGLKLWLPG
jgi:hypothetical protein